jgi:uncharacterized protein YecE (DUF72 family)
MIKTGYSNQESKMGKILIGTSSWSDPSLIKSGFYPPQTKTPEERLRYYSSVFSLAESDASYHVLPSQRLVRTWLEVSPTNFVFNLKAFSLLSGHPTLLTSFPHDLREEVRRGLGKGDHIYINHLEESTADKVWERFVQAISPLREAKKLGLTMFQYPPWFHPSAENYAYIHKCREKIRPLEIAVEFRAPGWFGPGYLERTLEFLRSRRVTLVCVDEPQGLKTSIPPVVEATSFVGAIRFHGRNSQAWDQQETSTSEKYDYLYSAEELEEWVPRILKLQRETEELHIIFKNKHLDHPVINALQMKRLLGL